MLGEVRSIVMGKTGKHSWKTNSSLTENMMVAIYIPQHITNYTHESFDWLGFTGVIKKAPSSDKKITMALNSLSFLFLSGTIQVESRGNQMELTDCSHSLAPDRSTRQVNCFQQKHETSSIYIMTKRLN